MRFLKILHVTPSYEPAWNLGGVLYSISRLCRGLVRLGHEVTVFTTDSAKSHRLEVPTNQRVEVGGVNVYYFSTRYNLKYAYSRELRQACSLWIKDFDIINLTSFWCYPAIPAVKAALHCQVPYMVSVRGTLRQSSLHHKFLKKWLYFTTIEKRHINRAAAIHFTAALERELAASYGFANPSFIVPNGFDPAEFPQRKGSPEGKAKFGISPVNPVVSFLGRLHRIKGVDLLIQAISQVSLADREVHLLVAGPDSGEEETLRKLSRHLGLEHRVHFLGRVAPAERNALFAASDILALVSRDENFGNAAVEAMLMGVPVMVSDRVGICREVLADGAGAVVPLEVQAMARTLAELLADGENLKTMGQRAAASARWRYAADVVAQHMARAYEDILTGRRSPELFWSDGQITQRKD
jgi:glycosyltransferase involved in cell wall biosynthesis